MKKPKTYWVVHELYEWGSVTAGGVKLSPPENGDGPDYFMPIFKTKKLALAFTKNKFLVSQYRALE